MRPELLALIAAASGTLLGGCLSRPPVRLETPEGLVLCEDPVVGERIARALREQGPRIRAALGSEREPPRIELWRDFPHGAGGFTAPDFIALNSLPEDIEQRAIHELVHWHSSPTFDRLPYYAREGLAEALTTAVRTLSSGQYGIRGSPVEHDLERTFAITSGDRALAGSDAFTENAGAWIVAAIGWKRLRDFCVRAEAEGRAVVPDDWLRAELPPLGVAMALDAAWVNDGVPGKPGGSATLHSPWRPPTPRCSTGSRGRAGRARCRPRRARRRSRPRGG